MKIETINSFILIFFEVCLATLLNPFVSWWLGSDAVFSNRIVYLLVFSNFITLSRNPILSIKTSAGLFEPDKFAPLIESFINLIVSCFLAHYIGLPGIVIGTIISSLFVPFWISPKIVYKYIFEKKFITYFLTFIRNAFYIIIVVLLISFIQNYISISNNTISLVVDLVISVISCIIFEMIIFSKNKYVIDFICGVKSKICNRIHSR